MALATLANARTSKRPGVTQNKKKTHKKGKRRNSATKTKNTSTALARRTTPTPMQVKKIEQNAKREQLASLKTRGLITQNKKKHKKGRKRKNGARTGILSFLPSMPNPSFRGIAGTLKTGAYGFAGGGAAMIVAALLLAGLDKIAPTWAQHRYAQTLATFVAAIIAIPLITSIRIFNFMGNDGKSAAVTGGVMLSLGQGVATLTGRNVLGSDIGNELVGGISSAWPSTGNAAADAAAKTVLQSGGTQQQAAAAAAGTMSGLRGNVSPLVHRRMPPQFEPAGRGGGIRTSRAF